MFQPFIRNDQYNWIGKQADQVSKACQAAADARVLESVKQSVTARIVDKFKDAEPYQLKLLEKVGSIKSPEDYRLYMYSLEPHVTAFEYATDKQLAKLFPKSNPKIPPIESVDRRFVTYFGWTDIGTNRMYIVYSLDGRLVGVEGRLSPLNKKSVCCFCNRIEEVALYSAAAKTRPAEATAEYYKAIGNYCCVNSETCNKNITDVTALERFIREVVG